MAGKIAIGADHGGFFLKEKIKTALKKARFVVEDLGTDSPDASDYPRIGFDVAARVSSGKAKRGIVICKTGIGMAIIANKRRGVRAGVCNSVAEALSARRHNDTNVLVLAATRISGEKAVRVVKAWLGAKALGARHARRVRQIKALEKKVFK
ncbi:MAG: RpiB/LacA/LacB family sugar-phosphate isomerase [Candidatus Omnitrophota bacterium]